MASSQPEHPEYGIIAMVPNDWGTKWMGRHQVFFRMSRYVNVVWVEPCRDWRSVLREESGSGQGSVRAGGAPGLSIYRHEKWLPEFYRPQLLARLTQNERLRRARRILTQKGCKRILLSLWKPQYAAALDIIPHDLSSYHIADEYTYSEVEQPPSREEAEIIRSVDQVFVQSQGLMDRKGGINPHTLFLPNGVDYEAYSKKQAEPEDIRNIPRPIIGYSGYIKRQLDWGLIEQLTARHRDWSFVFAGASKNDASVTNTVRNLARRDNVYFLGEKTFRELAAYPQHFDVCIMPYQVNAYTHCIYPLKLHEFLASATPVVGAAIRTLDDFANVVARPGDRDSWSAAIDDALHPAARDPDRVQARQAIARLHDWAPVTSKMLRTLAQRLYEKTGDTLVDRLDTGNGDWDK